MKQNRTIDKKINNAVSVVPRPSDVATVVLHKKRWPAFRVEFPFNSVAVSLLLDDLVHFVLHLLAVLIK